MFAKSILALLPLAILFSCTGHAKTPLDDPSPQWELFEAMKQEQIEVRFIPLGTDRANLLVTNKSKKPLHVRLPETFAAVPVLAQGFGGGGGGLGGGLGGGGGGLGGGGGGGQALGGGGGGGGGLGGGGGGGGFGGGGAGGGFFRIAPDRVKKVSVATVCLEHGKPDPNPRMEYTIVPLEQVTSNTAIRKLCQVLGHRQVTQNVAQAAAWNLMDGLSWTTLAEKTSVESKYTGSTACFSSEELTQAKTLTNWLKASTGQPNLSSSAVSISLPE